MMTLITAAKETTELLALCDGCLGWGWVWWVGVHGWVADRAGSWDVLATWVWGQQIQPLDFWVPNLHVRLRFYYIFYHPCPILSNSYNP